MTYYIPYYNEGHNNCTRITRSQIIFYVFFHHRPKLLIFKNPIMIKTIRLEADSDRIYGTIKKQVIKLSKCDNYNL